MDTEKINVLLTALTNGSLSAAAEKLDYTPSGISRSVAALEEEIGFPLLLRSRNGVVPTRECQILLPALRDLLRAETRCRQIRNEINGLEIGEIAVGTAYFKYYPQLCQWIAAFSEKYPGINIRLAEGRSSKFSEMLEKGALDFCIISKRENPCRWYPLRQDELMACVPKNHPLAAESALSLAHFAAAPYIEIFPGQVTDNSRLFEREGIYPNICYSTDNDEAAFAMVEAGLGITLVNSLQIPRATNRMKLLPLAPRQWVEIGIALPLAEALSPAAKKFADFVMRDFPCLR